ncbi:hypothetical protein OH807_31865 [Kitasatospora sp. NBC_01560]|uniref:hypothetical protein n=1 Tax=Kitasatospora sp. NBC_01560 TaxID=2975965 RepID=UPI003868DB11
MNNMLRTVVLTIVAALEVFWAAVVRFADGLRSSRPVWDTLPGRAAVRAELGTAASPRRAAMTADGSRGDVR